MAKYHKISQVMGVARVNGDLAVSRAGLRIDLQFKSSCRDIQSNRSEVTEVWWFAVGPTLSKLLKLDLKISQVQNRRIIQYALHQS